MKKYFSLSLALASLLVGIHSSIAQKFTLPILPDTQNEVHLKPEMFFSQIDWLVKEKQRLLIPMVLHVGDVVQHDVTEQWETASEGFDRLDRANIPYAIAVGNHDTGIYHRYKGKEESPNLDQQLRDTRKLNAYFPVHRFTHQRGQFEAGKIDNAYYTFKVHNTNWLVVSLEYSPRLSAIHWAGDVIKEYPKHNVIILTHLYLNPKGIVPDKVGAYGDTAPQLLFDKLIKKHANIKFVLSGHFHGASHRVDKGEAGNTVYQLLQDWQGEDFGAGYIRLLEFDLATNTVNTRLYSPYYNKTKEDDSKVLFEHVELIK